MYHLILFALYFSFFRQHRMSNIIPMVSSSPPPMDEGGGFEWDDDDDDFGTFTSASVNSFAQSGTT